MEHKITPLPRSEIEITVIIPFLEFEPYVKKAAVLISEENEIEGFRRGKAPYDIVKQRIGESVIYERAAELAARESYPRIFNELVSGNQLSATNSPIGRPANGEARPIVPIGRPEVTVTKLAPGNELEYKVKIVLLPGVQLPDYREIARKILKVRPEVLVSEEEVTKTIDWIRESRAPLITVDRPAKIGDRIEVDFEIRHGGVKIAQGDSKNHPLILGSNKFLPGFEDAFIGAKAGEEKKFSILAPENWRDASLAGKSIDVAAAVRIVQERPVPELTDDFAKNLGNFSSVEALQSSIREGLYKEKQSKEKERLRAMIIEEIAKEAEIEAPEILMLTELEKMTEELKSGVEGMGMKWEDYLSHTYPAKSQTPEASADALAQRTSNGVKKLEEELKAGWKSEAEKRVRFALCLREIALLEKIEAGEKEVEERVNQLLDQYRSAKEAEGDIDPEKLKEYARGIIKNERVLEFLESVQ